MELTPVKLEDLSSLKYSFSTCDFEKHSTLKAIVAGFEGELGFKSYGHDDAYFMCVMMQAALTAWRPAALVIDLRLLAYEWGDSMRYIFDIWYRSRAGHGPLPTAIVVADHNRKSMTGIVQFVNLDVERWLFDSVEDAMNALEAELKPAQ